jgi:lysyl-tRNA synthetase class 2
MNPKEKTSISNTSDNIKLNEDEIRLAKVQKLIAMGHTPWPEYKHVEFTTKQALEYFEKNKDEQNEYTLAGRLVNLRDHGKTFFGNIQDRHGKIQIYIKKDILGESQFDFLKNFIDVGDIIWIKGTLFVTKTGEVTLKIKELELLSKCLYALPEKFHGLTDIEQRYRQRYLDLISNPESREKFKKRSNIVWAIREFFNQNDFLEVETPMLHPIPGGANARPFITHHNAYNIDLYLRIAPELYLKRLVVGGFERVFEINRNFRNEGISTKHNPEFTMLEFYTAHTDYLIAMDFTEKLISYVIQKNFPNFIFKFQDRTIDFTPPFARMTLEESLIKIGELTQEQIAPKNIDNIIKQNNIELIPGSGHGAKLFALFEKFVEGKIINPTFIIGYPVEVSPLAKRNPKNSELTSRFELFVNGMELANGFTELNDPFDQAERFRMQESARASGDIEAQHFDADYITALEYGLAPTAGVGVGIDRLTMFLTDTQSIKDVILFPTLKIIKE